jgi:hypothetical protein
MELPLRFVINGAATTMKVALKGNELVLQAHAIPIDKALKRGWGRVELPTDASPANNVFHFVFDEPLPLHSAIVSEDDATIAPLRAALSAAADPARKYLVTTFTPARAAEIPWEETALLVWHAPIPKPDDGLARLLQNHVTAGRAVLFLPPETPDDSTIFGLGWEPWRGDATDKPQGVEWWRNDADLLANARDGSALPVGTLEVLRHCGIRGEGVPLARIADRQPLLIRSALSNGGGAYFLGTLPATSSLARDGVVMFALLHRALNDGARTLGKARQRTASATALGGDSGAWQLVEQKGEPPLTTMLPLRAGVLRSDEQLAAINRPPGEDQPGVLSTITLGELFAGLDFRVLTDSLEDGRSLTNEIWRTFLIAMAVALIAEALLCMPARRETRSIPAT